MDALDHSILAILQKDGRKPFTEIAKMLSVTEGTVRNRVSKLIEDQVVQISGLVNPHYLGYNAPAIIGVSVKPPYLDEAAAQIATFPEVAYLVMVSGEFDLMVEVFCRDREHLASLLKDQLRRVPGVQRTETFFILHTFKLAQGARPSLSRNGPLEAS